jgi:hypothetical protein
MNIYKIYKDNWSVLKNFDSMFQAQMYAESLGVGYSVEYVGPYTPPSIEVKIQQDIQFCTQLTDRFLKENREAGITEQQSVALLAQFKDIMSMAQVGAVPSVYTLLQGVTVGEIYTQERKDRDLADLLNYMNS